MPSIFRRVLYFKYAIKIPLDGAEKFSMGTVPQKNASPGKSENSQKAPDAMDDLESIMKELDDLQKSSSKPELKVISNEKPNDEDGLEAFRAPGGSESDASLEETLSGMADDPASQGTSEKKESLLDALGPSEDSVEDSEAEAHHDFDEIEENEMKAVGAPRPLSSDESGTLSMTLSGPMTLRLKYALGDQEVSVSFENHFLKVQLADGTEFKIPVQRSHSS